MIKGDQAAEFLLGLAKNGPHKCLIIGWREVHSKPRGKCHVQETSPKARYLLHFISLRFGFWICLFVCFFVYFFSKCRL